MIQVCVCAYMKNRKKLIKIDNSEWKVQYSLYFLRHLNTTPVPEGCAAGLYCALKTKIRTCRKIFVTICCCFVLG